MFKDVCAVKYEFICVFICAFYQVLTIYVLEL